MVQWVISVLLTDVACTCAVGRRVECCSSADRGSITHPFDWFGLNMISQSAGIEGRILVPVTGIFLGLLTMHLVLATFMSTRHKLESLERTESQ